MLRLPWPMRSDLLQVPFGRPMTSKEPRAVEADRRRSGFKRRLRSIQPGPESVGFPREQDGARPAKKATAGARGRPGIRLAEGTVAFNDWRTELKKSEKTARGASGKASYRTRYPVKTTTKDTASDG